MFEATGINSTVFEGSSVPDGWRWVRLGDHVTKIGSGITPRGGQTSYLRSGIPLIRSQNVHMNRFEPNGLAFISLQQDEEMEGSRVQTGDVLLNITGASIGRVCVVPSELCPANVNQHVSIIRGNGSFEPEFLSFFISTPDFQKSILDLQAGATRQALTKSLIEDFRIPLPSIPEQKRIAAILKEQMVAVEQARAAAESQLKAAKDLPVAYLRDVFDSSEAKKWDVKLFGELVDNFDGLRIPVKQEDRLGRKGQYPYYGASGIIDYVDEYLFDGEFLLIGEDGANLIMRSSPIAFRAEGKFWVNNHAHVVKPKDGVSLDYLLHFFAITNLEPYVTGAAQPKLTQKDLNRVPVPIPPQPEMTQIVKTLNSKISYAEELSKVVKDQLDTINKLPAVLLRQAFTGKL